MKTSTKIILLLSVVSFIIVVAFGTAIYYFTNKHAYVDFYERLETRARISAQYNLEPRNLNVEHLRTLRQEYLKKLEAEKEYLLELQPGADIPALAASQNLPAELIEHLAQSGSARQKKGSLFYAGLRVKKNNRSFLVVVSAENYYVSHHQLFLKQTLLAGVILAALLIVLLSVFFSRQIFVPIKNITHKVRQISTESIHQRLEVRQNNNEISELAHTFNDLLNRIETAFETQKNFISNASHELGTPLTAIIGEADVALLKERSASEYQKTLGSILHQAERLDGITKSLLFLAQTGYTGKSIPFIILRVDEIIWETKALIDKLNPGNRIALDLDLLPEDPVKLKVRGNKQLLHLAFANILNNACKYSGNKAVTVFIASSGSHVIVTIVDQGIGIPADEMPFIYDPFFRASNTRLFEGYGIGLPLTRNIIHMHHGQLLVSSAVNSGTTVEIKLPLI